MYSSNHAFSKYLLPTMCLMLNDMLYLSTLDHRVHHPLPGVSRLCRALNAQLSSCLCLLPTASTPGVCWLSLSADLRPYLSFPPPGSMLAPESLAWVSMRSSSLKLCFTPITVPSGTNSLFFIIKSHLSAVLGRMTFMHYI